MIVTAKSQALCNKTRFRVGGRHLFSVYYFTVHIFCAICGISMSNVIENVVVGSPCNV